MIYFLNVLVLILIAFLELTVFPHIKIFNQTPLLIIFFIITLSYFRKGVEPFILAAVCGIFFDLFSSTPFGYWVIFLMLIVGIMQFVFHEGMKTLSFWHYFFLVLCWVFVFFITQAVVLITNDVIISASNIQFFLLGVIVNMIYAIIFYTLAIWYFDKISDLESKISKT